jgi:hypothetical protein
MKNVNSHAYDKEPAYDDELNRPMLWLAGFFVVMFVAAFAFATIGKNPQQVAATEKSMTSGDVLMLPITQPAIPEPTTTGQGPSR